jgi:hypothetical protein
MYNRYIRSCIFIRYQLSFHGFLALAVFSGRPVPTVPSRLFSLDCPMSIPDCSLLAGLCLLSCPGFPLPAVLSRLSFSGCLVLTVHFWLSCPDRRVPDALSRLFCPGCPALAGLSRLSCPGCPVSAVLAVLCDCSFLAVLSWMSCTGYLVPLSCPSWLSCPGFPVPTRLSFLGFSIPAVLSRLSYTILS